MKTDDPSYVLKIDRMTGKTLWRVERPTPAVRGSPDSYTTPAWVEANGRVELIITGGDVVSGHGPATGNEYWHADVLNPTRGSAYRITASPTIVDGLIIAPTGNNPLTAMRPGGSGDVAATHVVWTIAQGPDVPTPVSDGKLLYCRDLRGSALHPHLVASLGDRAAAGEAMNPGFAALDRDWRRSCRRWLLAVLAEPMAQEYQVGGIFLAMRHDLHAPEQAG
ncbi:MAG: PQQ-binding-like beta-propeller repeat protein [Vicinamibacterales bacterium]